MPSVTFPSLSPQTTFPDSALGLMFPLYPTYCNVSLSMFVAIPGPLA
jgi:hypothetical protein